jgi:ribosome-binding factor A
MNKHRRKRGAHAPPAHDVCVDADVYFGETVRDEGRHQRKAEQLRVAIQHALVAALECDIDDPVLAGLSLYDVAAEPGGSFAALFATDRPDLLEAAQVRLRDAAPVFRNAMAQSLTRKKVPTVTFYVVPAAMPEVADE